MIPSARRTPFSDLRRSSSALGLAAALLCSSQQSATSATKTASKAPEPAKADSVDTRASKRTPSPSKPENGNFPKATPAPSPKPKYGPNVSLAPEDLVEFETQPEEVQSLIRQALALTKQNLTYTYGSADPQNGGMDCSGTIYYLLHAAGFTDVPRDSAGQYVWTRREGHFEAVIGRSEKSFEFDHLRPGALLFWRGTYRVEREFPITHVMLYLGTERKTKRRVMFGASDGRTYAGVPRWGVSVFDFRMPKSQAQNGEGSRVLFVGYGTIPGLQKAPKLAKDAPKGKP